MKNRYLSFTGSDPVVFAHYTYEQGQADHTGCIVGWDDTFPASRFREDHQPPADGAWIVKNSWGEEWGMDGYFYLSYYDKNISCVETYAYIHPDDVDAFDHLSIFQYDMLPANTLSSTLFDAPVYAANVFPVEEDSVLQFVSVMTGDLNTQVTASIYRLDEGTKDPMDGVLLESVTESFLYAGYHRIRLPENITLRAGERIGITVLERVQGTDGGRYALVNTSGMGRKAAGLIAQSHENDPWGNRYYVARVNRGESFVKFPGDNWMDWKDATRTISRDGYRRYMVYDNLPVKGYAYPLDQVLAAHQMDIQADTFGGTVSICTECGYILHTFDQETGRDGASPESFNTTNPDL